MMHDRLLRPAMVGVSKKSQQESKTDTKAEIKENNLVEEKDPQKQNILIITII